MGLLTVVALSQHTTIPMPGVFKARFLRLAKSIRNAYVHISLWVLRDMTTEHFQAANEEKSILFLQNML
jgi:hypothetical protein